MLMGYRSDVAIAVSIPTVLYENEQIFSLIDSHDRTNFELVKQLMVNFKLSEDDKIQMKLIEYLLFDYDYADELHIEKNYIKIMITSVKWYDDYEYVKIITDLIDLLHEEDFGFIRIGEDYDDIETRGDYWEFGMSIYRSISFW